MGRIQRKIASRVHLPDPWIASSAENSTSGRFTKCHRYTSFQCHEGPLHLYEDERHPRHSELPAQGCLCAELIMMHVCMWCLCGMQSFVRFTQCDGGCRLPVTALAVTSDDASAYSVSKDGSIFCTDIESGSRQAFPAYSQTGLDVM